MKFYENIAVFKFPWEQVVQVHWQRYPNPYSSHVLNEDTVFRKVIGNSLHSKRILTKEKRIIPKWGEHFNIARHVNIIEESIVNPEKKEFSTYTRNVGLTKYMGVVEKVTYRPNSENSQWTDVKRQAWIDSKIFGFGYAIQQFGLNRYKTGIQKTSAGYIYVLNRLFPIAENAMDLTQNHHMTLEERKQRLKDAAKETAKRAKELAQEKAGPIYAACEGVRS